MKTMTDQVLKDRMQSCPTGDRFIGIDVGAETIKAVELFRNDSGLVWSRRQHVEHHKDPETRVLALLREWNWGGVTAAAVTGRGSRHMDLPAVPVKQAQARGAGFLLGDNPITVISIGSHGFSVLERRASGIDTFRANSRCSQGTGNFLRQLVERFGLSVAEASDLCTEVEDPAPLSGRCPVILKTDMTHLANKGEDRARILAGLFDAVCENVTMLLNPGTTPERVILSGGVSRSARVRKTFAKTLHQTGMRLEETTGDDALYLDALGCAVMAAQRPVPVPPLEKLHVVPQAIKRERLPPLADWMDKVTRMPPLPRISLNGHRRPLTLGFDIGSTGSKAVALDLETSEVLWEGYRRTGGAPVEAAQALLREFLSAPAARYPILGLGVTGSGREIVGSLMSTCYGQDSITIINEIAAHAAGALHCDPSVDTIFEIGGQDAKYIRLAGGRIVDCAMNEACSAGTGSFIEEQGCRFPAIQDVVALNDAAMGASSGVSLGQHCSVLMAEVIEEATAAGMAQDDIIAGLYDAIIQNYLHRVKGNRSVGKVIFCQGMPFAADALAAAVARQTGGNVIVPPNPGTIGALGIALLSRGEMAWRERDGLDLQRFLEATIEKKETFVCASTKGCGGCGNHCRVDRIKTIVAGQRQAYTWGGACSLYDKGTRRRKLPDRTPDPFKERQVLVSDVVGACAPKGLRPRVAITDEFALNGLFPFFTRFLYELGLDLVVVSDGDQTDLKHGIQSAGVPLCAPMQLYHGIVQRMVAQKPDILFLPRIRELSRVDHEHASVTCPMLQASPDLVGPGLKDLDGIRVATPVIELGEGQLDSPAFMRCCRGVARSVGRGAGAWRSALRKARETQLQFDAACEEVGRHALSFCREHAITPVVVLGRSYTLYSRVLNSNVPPILREQGALAIPLDCYPVRKDTPTFPEMYWGYGQRILRAAHQVRRTPGEYSLYCSNYSCGPDSFILHFYGYIMEGRPYAIIETDGHAGDAGTKTRVEAFLHCVAQDTRSAPTAACPEFGRVEGEVVSLAAMRQQGVTVLIPSMGPGAQAIAACFRGVGLRVDVLPAPDRKTLQLGRRHTSGKECVPVCLTLGSLLQRLQDEKDGQRRFVFLMPKTEGPCRLGVYHILHRIVLEKLGWRKRVKIWSPSSADYFADLPSGFAALVLAGMAGMDLLAQALHDVRPVETDPARAQAIHHQYTEELIMRLEQQARRDPSAATAMREVGSGRIFGIRDLLSRAGADFAAVRGSRLCPTVLLTGEIYVRSEAFANDFVAQKLEAQGIRVRLTPASEWLDYVRHLTDLRSRAGALRVTSLLQKRLQRQLHNAMARHLQWPPLLRAEQTIAFAGNYVDRALHGEAILTVGGAIAEWRHGRMDGVVNVGPLECMPSKIAESQFIRIAEDEGLLSTTLSLDGDPLERGALDNFVFEVKSHFEERHPPSAGRPGSTRKRRLKPAGNREEEKGQTCCEKG